MIGEDAGVQADELVVLQKFEGDPEPENEFERLTIHNGEVISHDKVEHGEVVGPVDEESLVGANIGNLFPTDVKEVD